MLTRKKIQTGILLVFGIILLVNFIGNRFFVRLDFTEDQRYSLSDATKDILADVDEPITVTAYFSEDLPPNIAKVKNDFKDLLIEYDNYSDGNVVYEFVNPNEDQQTEMQAQQSGIRPVMINVRERDQVKQQRAYLGAVLQYKDKKEVIPYIEPGAAMEYAISSAIKKMTIKKKPQVAFLQGNGEPGLSELNQLREAISYTTDVSTIDFSDTSVVPDKYETLVVIAPKDTVPGNYFKYLDDFLARGGRLLVALNRVNGNLQTAQGEKQYTGFGDWLEKKGIEVQNNIVIDANCSNVMVRQQQGSFVMNTPVRFPYLPVITNFADHPITKGLESVVLPFASSIVVTAKDTTLNFTKLAETSEKSATMNLPVSFNISKEWAAGDFPESHLAIGVAVEGKIDGTNTKMVVFGDGDFAVNGQGQQSQKLQEDNVNLMANAIDWLTDDTGLVSLRTKGITSRPIDPSLEDGTKSLLKYLNFLLPIILVVAYGIFRFQVKKNIKNRLMSIDYGE